MIHASQSGTARLQRILKDAYAVTDKRIEAVFPADSAAQYPPELAAQGSNYLICYVPRSGSTHLVSLLQHTGLMGKPADFLNPDYVQLPRDEDHILAATGVHTISWAYESYGVQNMGQYLDFLGRSTRTANGVFGMKVDLYHASMLLRRKMFSDTQSAKERGALGWKYVYLTRENLLMQAISYFRAIHSGSWTSVGTVGKPHCEYDEEGILQCLENLAEFMRKWELVFSLLGIQPLRVTYEHLESDAGSVVRRVMGLVDLVPESEAIPLRSQFERQRSEESFEWAERVRRYAAT